MDFVKRLGHAVVRHSESRASYPIANASNTLFEKYDQIVAPRWVGASCRSHNYVNNVI